MSKMIKKIFILGLDGLEYNLVEKWNLIHLKQSEYGKLEVPINLKVGVPISPEVWASFLTGKYISAEFKRPFILKILMFLRRYVNLSLGLGKKIGHRKFPKLREKTFLDLTNSKEINVPYYSYDHAVFKIYLAFYRNKLSLKETIAKLNSLYEKRKKQILDSLTFLEQVDVLFAYLHFPDALQHFIPSILRLKEHYIDLDSYVKLLKDLILRKDLLFIIVSDHGFDVKVKNHSTYGFWSLNRQINFKPKNVTNFYHFILKNFKQT
jgi:hypothetical protein